MIRTLRITSIVAGLLAVVLLVVFSMVGVKGDPELEKLLKSPSVVEQYLRNKDKPSATRLSPSSRLDEVAKGFAKVINPPPSAQPADGPGAKAGPQNPRSAPTRVSGKFKLLATSVSVGDPNLSRAFVEMPTVDQKRSWVRIGQSIEREGWTIQAIKDGSIVYGDGQQKQEIQVEERQPRISLLDNGEPRAPRPTKVAEPAAAPVAAAVPAPAAIRAARQVRRPTPPGPGLNPPPNPSAAVRPPNAEQNARDLEKLADKLRNLRTDANDNALPPDKEKLRQEAMEMLVARLQATRAAQAEANSVGEPEKSGESGQGGADPNEPQ